MFEKIYEYMKIYRDMEIIMNFKLHIILHSYMYISSYENLIICASLTP